MLHVLLGVLCLSANPSISAEAIHTYGEFEMLVGGEDKCNGADADLAGRFCGDRDDMPPDECCTKLAAKVCPKAGQARECYFRKCNAVANGGTFDFAGCMKKKKGEAIESQPGWE